MNNITAGPWTTYRGSVWSESPTINKKDRSNIICTISDKLKVPDREKEANAKLIAAAPELLEALEGLLKTAPVGDISRVGKAEWEANGVIVPNYAKVLAAREAIAKATT